MYKNSNPNFPDNHGKFWSKKEYFQVGLMRGQGYTIYSIARKLKRTVKSVRNIVEDMESF